MPFGSLPWSHKAERARVHAAENRRAQRAARLCLWTTVKVTAQEAIKKHKGEAIISSLAALVALGGSVVVVTGNSGLVGQADQHSAGPPQGKDGSVCMPSSQRTTIFMAPRAGIDLGTLTARVEEL